jgi:hypothetical protein
MPDDPSQDAPLFTHEDNQAYTRQVISLYRITAAHSREQITAAIEDTTKRDALTLAERMLCDQIVTCSYLTPELQPEIAEALNVSPEKIEEYLAKINPIAQEPEQTGEQDEQLELFPLEQAQKENKEFDLNANLPYLLMAQRDGINRIRTITHKNTEPRLVEVDNEPGVKMERISRKGDKASVTIRLEEKDKAYIMAAVKKWRVSVKMLMDYAIIKLTEQNNYVGKAKRGKIDLEQFQHANRIIAFSLEEWMKMRGIPQTKAALDHERQTVIEDCKTLFRTSLEWEERRKGGKTEHWKGVHPFPFAEVKNSEVKIEIGTYLAAYLLTAPVMPYRVEFLQISNRTPNAYLMATKLAELCNINGHRRARPSYIVSVSALLDATDYPTKEVVYKNMNRRYTDYIINPFLKAMREIQSVSSLKWEFCQEGGKPLSDGMQPDKKIDDFLKAYIKYNFTDEQALDIMTETT